MKLKYFLMIIFLFFKIDFLFSQQSYYFATVLNDTPYVVINNPKILHKIERHLLTYLYNNNWYGEHLPVFISSQNGVFIDGLYLDYFSSEKRFKFWRLGGALRHNLGYSKGDKLNIQLPTKGCSTESIVVKIDDILYCPLGTRSFVILRCLPSIPGKKSFDKFHETFLIATRKKPYGKSNKVPQQLLKNPIPDRIKKSLKDLAKIFYPSKFGPLDEPLLTIQPVIYKTTQIYYICVISYGYKPRKGILYLLDDEGEVLQKIGNEQFHKIVGITDTDNNGTNEIMVSYGDSYGGGYKILNLEKSLGDLTVRLVIRAKLETVFD